MFKKIPLVLAALLLTATSAQATCAYKNTVPVKAYFAAFPAWKVAAEAMKECAGPTRLRPS